MCIYAQCLSLFILFIIPIFFDLWSNCFRDPSKPRFSVASIHFWRPSHGGGNSFIDGKLMELVDEQRVTADIPTKIWLLVWNHSWNLMTFHILRRILPTDELIFFRGVGIPPTIYSSANQDETLEIANWNWHDMIGFLPCEFAGVYSPGCVGGGGELQDAANHSNGSNCSPTAVLVVDS